MSTVPRPSFRIYAGPPDSGDTSSDSKTPPSLGLSLAENYLGYLLPEIRLSAADPRSAGTIDKDFHALGWLERIMGDPRSGAQMPLAAIDRRVLKDFSEQLARWPSPRCCGRPLAQNTRRAIAIHLQKLLDLFGPASRRNEDALGFWSEAPWIKAPPAEEARVKDIWRLEEIGAILDACRSSSPPRAEWFQDLIVFVYNTGLRIGTAMQATWDLVDRDDPGFLAIPPAIYKGHLGHPLKKVWLNPWAREAIDRRRAFVKSRRLLFGSDSRPWLEEKSWLNGALHRIKARSGLPAHRLERFGFHALRGACGDQLDQIHPEASGIVLGHRGGITRRCYKDQERIMVECLNRLPQPKFERQLRLSWSDLPTG
jgi:integrase